MALSNLIEKSDNYSKKLGSLYQFKRDEEQENNADLDITNSQSFKCKTRLVEKTIGIVL